MKTGRGEETALADRPRIAYTIGMGRRECALWMVGLLLGGCVEYVPRSSLPDLGAPNPRDLEGSHQVDVLVQAGEPMVDVLWVVDNSCSMVEEQEGIASNFPVFLDYFEQSNLDWHIGVISTDMGDPLHQGKLQARMGYKWVDPYTPFPSDVLGAMTRLGTGGTGYERGRDPIYYALEIHREGYNQGFYRPGAGLHVIVISDEDDSSELISEEEFLSWFRRLKWAGDQLTFSSIVSAEPLCDGAYEVGSAYLRYTEEIGGIFWSICDQNWAQVLQQLGLQAVETEREYYLSRLPIPGTIEVTLTEGDTVFAFEEFEDWNYNPIRNSITFTEYVPRAGNIITIEYDVNTGVTDPDDGTPPVGVR